jgi:multimeric flavodoxin WrbA
MDILIIDSVRAYSIGYTTCAEEEKKELSVPELVSYPESIHNYDIIILGYPNRLGTMPMPVWLNI